MKKALLAGFVATGLLFAPGCSSDCADTNSITFTSALASLSSALVNSPQCATINTRIGELNDAYNNLCDEVKLGYTAQYQSMLQNAQDVASNLGC